jgi:hypothetical protein
MPAASRTFASLAIASACALCLVATARAEWPEAGVRVTGPANLRALLPDGAGGAIVTWTTGSSGNEQVRVLRIAFDGSLAAGWPAEGRQFADFPRLSFTSVAPDGLGGFYLLANRDTLLRAYDFLTRSDLLAWKFDEQGELAPGWAATGLLLDSRTSSIMDDYHSSWFASTSYPDSVDGAFLMYGTYTSNYTGYDGTSLGGRHVDAAGATWSISIGSYDSHVSLFGGQLLAVGDGEGGVVGLTAIARIISVVRYATSGQAAARTLVSYPSGSGSDLASGAIVPILPGADVLVRTRYTRYPDPQPSELLWRLGRNLETAPGWPDEGAVGLPVPVLGDGVGGAFCTADEGGITRLQRFSFDTSAPLALWPGPGLPVLRAGLRAIDGGGGLFQVWLAGANGSSLLAEHVQADGRLAPQWAVGGAQLASAARAPLFAMPAGPGRALVAWTDSGADSGSIYLQLLADDAPVPAAASLVSADAFTDRVRIEWQVSGVAAAPAVERRVSDATWTRIGAATPAGFERWSYEDRDVRPGDALAYRLAGPDGTLPGSEASVLVPVPATFALRGFVENPSAHGASLEFSLPDAAPAKLEVLDVAGRVLARREVGALGAGTHRLELPELRAMQPGLVFVRLSRAGASVVVRGTHLR